MESRPSVSRLVRAAREAAEIRAKEEASATDDTSEAHGASKAARDPEEEEKELERTKVKAELLRANSFVNRLPPRLQQELACAAKVRIVHEESPVILEQGDDVHKLAILCEGEAIVTHKADADDRHGVERPVRIDQAPASYGAYALLSGDEEQPETVRAIGPDCLCLELNGDDFDEILSNHNNAGFVLELRREARQAGLLDRVPLLSGLNDMQKVQILHAMRTIVFQDGEILAARAAREEVFLLVVNGTVRVKDLDATEEIEGDSSSSVPAPVSQVSYFGEFALLDDQRNAQTLVAEGEVVCLYMHRLAFLEQVPHLRRFLVEWVQASQRQSERRTKGQERPEDSRPTSSASRMSKGSESDTHGPRAHCFDLDKPPCKSFAASIDKSASEAFEILVPARSEDAKPRRMAFESVYEALALRVFHKKIANSEFTKTFQIVSSRSQASPALRSLRGEIPAVSSNLLDVLASAQREEKLRKKKKKKKKNKNQKKNKKGNAMGSSAAIARIETPLAAAGHDSALLSLTSRLAHHVRTILQSDPEQRSQEDLRVLHGLFAQNKVVARLALRLDAPIEHRLFSHARFATFEAGQSLWQEGDAMTGVYMVLRGQVHTSMRERIGTSGTVVPKPLGTICAGGSLGELSLLDPEHKVYTKALYTAQALCDTEVLVLDAQSFHAHCVPQDLLRQRIADVSSIEQLSCTRGEANFAAIMPLAFQIDYAHFPKDFVFSQAGDFFEPGWCHFIMSGEIGVYEYNLDRRCWEELSRLGPGEFMSIADASPTLALAAVSFVSTKKLSRATLQALDETAAAEMNQVATFRAQFRKADDVHGVRARLAAAKICLPTFVQRQGGPLQRPSIAALAASTRAKHADAQASKVKMSRLAPLFKDGKVPPDQDGSSDAGSQDLTQYPADPDLQQEQRQQQDVEAKPVWSWAALPAAEPQQDGEDSDTPHSGLTRENALGALRLVERHYSMAIEERHHAVCHTDAGIKRRSVGPEEHTSSLAVRRALLDKKLFLERALAARDPRKRVPILRQQRFALVSLNWGDK